MTICKMKRCSRRNISITGCKLWWLPTVLFVKQLFFGHHVSVSPITSPLITSDDHEHRPPYGGGKKPDQLWSPGMWLMTVIHKLLKKETELYIHCSTVYNGKAYKWRVGITVKCMNSGRTQYLNFWMLNLLQSAEMAHEMYLARMRELWFHH